MGVFKRIEEREGVSFLMSWVEEDNLVLGRIIVFLVSCQKDVGAKVGKHLSYAMYKNIRMLIFVVGFDMTMDALTDITDEVVGIGFCRQLRGDQIGMALVTLERVVQKRSVPKLFCSKIITEGLEEVKDKGIYESGRTLQFLLKLLNLSSHLVLLFGRILIYVVVVEYIAVLLHELLRTEIVIQLWNGHRLHKSFFYRLKAAPQHKASFLHSVCTLVHGNCNLMSLISYG